MEKQIIKVEFLGIIVSPNRPLTEDEIKKVQTGQVVENVNFLIVGTL